MNRFLWILVGVAVFALAPFTVMLGLASLPRPSELDNWQGDFLGIWLLTWGVVLVTALGAAAYGCVCIACGLSHDTPAAAH